MFSFTQITFALLGAAAVSAAPAPATEQQLSARANSGKATFFTPGLGACGWNSGSGDMIAALSSDKYDGGSQCGKWVTVNHNGASTAVKIVDECPTCESNSLDLSPSAFSKLASKDEGLIDIKWHYN